MNQSREYQIKTAFLGEPATGKSSTHTAIAKNPYPIQDRYTPTPFMAFENIMGTHENKKIRCDVWDIAGENKSIELLKKSLNNTAVYIIFAEIHIEFDQQKEQIKKWYDIILNSIQVSEAFYIVNLTKADSDLQIDAQVISQRLNSWLLTLEDARLKYNGLCVSSAKEFKLDDFKNLLFKTANKYLIKSKIKDRLVQNRCQFFPGSYSELTKDEKSLQEKLIALFDDYIINWGFHWRHHYLEAQYLISALSSCYYDTSIACYDLIEELHYKMLLDSDFNPQGSFSRRLQYAEKLAEEKIDATIQPLNH